MHYVSEGNLPASTPQCRAAIITELPEVALSDNVSLFVLDPVMGLRFRDVVCYDDGGLPGTWHWPERVN